MSRVSDAKKVCHVSTVHSADDTRVFWRECVGLAELGYDVTLLARAEIDGHRAGVSVLALETYSSRWRRPTVGLWRATQRAWGVGADLYHFHDPELLPLLIALRLRGKVVVYDAHELLSAQVQSKPYLPRWARLPARVLASAIEWIAGRTANAVVTVSEACAVPFPPAKTTVVANYPGRNEIASSPDVGSPPAIPLSVVYVGGISRIRGILQLVETMEIVNRDGELRLALYGPFEDGALQEEAARMPGWAYVDYYGTVPHEKVGEALLGSVAGVITFLPTQNNVIGTPNKFFEYLAAGLPVVASDFPAWRSMLEGINCCLFVDPNSPESMARALVELRDNPTRARAMGAAGRKAVEENFTWERQIDQLDATYRRLLQSN